MNVLAAVKTISFAADVARTLELQKHLRSLVVLIKARKQKGKPKSEIDLLDEEIEVLGETVAILVEQMKALEQLQLRMAAFEEWSSLPWWKRMFSKPKAVTVDSSVPALQSKIS